MNDGETEVQGQMNLPKASWRYLDQACTRRGSSDPERICLKELTNTRQVGQLVALHILGIHAVKQEGAIQVVDERHLWIQIPRHGDPEPGSWEGGGCQGFLRGTWHLSCSPPSQEGKCVAVLQAQGGCAQRCSRYSRRLFPRSATALLRFILG